MGGHFISALIGLCITKLFALSSHWESLRWLAGSLSASVAIVVMQMTATTHPPAGATALLAAVNDEVFEIGWYYLPVILLSSTLILAVALLINNIQRRYPVYWFEPAAPPAPPPPAPSAPTTPARSGPRPPPAPQAEPTAPGPRQHSLIDYPPSVQAYLPGVIIPQAALAPAGGRVFAPLPSVAFH